MTSNVPSNFVAFPSVSSSLHSLPHATSMQNVSLHPNMYAQRAAESEAKLQKALSKTASSYSSQNPPPVPAYMVPVRVFTRLQREASELTRRALQPPSSSQDPSALVMRKPKTKV
ncbi:hypothetical protein BDQ17DRAFT_396354 [Cyathus striatus]|nr:hypothetical protein BDQ17DRAFT_396354 [Cyathus striatus]